SLPELEEALKDPKTNTLARVFLVTTIGIIGRDFEVNNKTLLAVFVDAATPDELRIALAETLGVLGGDGGAVDALKTELAKADGSVELRRACVRALDSFGPKAKPALPELKKALYDKDKFVRTDALHAIGRIGKDLGDDRKEIVKELLVISNE